MPAHAHKKEAEGRIARISVLPTQRKEVKALSEALGHTKRRSFRWKLEGQRGEQAVLPAPVVSALEQVVEVLARGDAVTVVSVAQELTTQEAADMLNVSRQYLVRLAEGGDIPCTKTGTHRRLRVDDVLAYKRRRDRERKKGLDRLSKLGQEIGGYDELR